MLPPEIRIIDIETHFVRHGEILSVFTPHALRLKDGEHLSIDTRIRAGFAFIEFADSTAAASALREEGKKWMPLVRDSAESLVESLRSVLRECESSTDISMWDYVHIMSM